MASQHPLLGAHASQGSLRSATPKSITFTQADIVEYIEDDEERKEEMNSFESNRFMERTDSCPQLVRVDSQAGTSSVGVSTVNLFKGIVGAGVLSLPNGVAKFSDSRSGLVPALLIAGCLGAFSAYSFWSIGRMCMRMKRVSYVNMMVCVYGEGVRLPVEALIVAKTTTAILIYSIIIGDMSRDLGQMFHLTGIISKRAALLGLVSVLVLLPLSLQRSLAKLAPVAALGSAGVLYITIFMALRLYQGAYAPNGVFSAEAPFEPSFDQKGTLLLPVFKLVSMLSTAYIAHFNAPKFASQLIDPTSGRFAVVTGSAFFLSYLVMAGVMVFGFLTFGGACQGLILNNYALTDWCAAVARVATIVSVTAGYPFIMVACRDGWVDLALRILKEDPLDRHPLPWMKKGMTVLMVLLVSGIAMVVDNLGLVVEIVGAVLATSLIYILPALAFIGETGPNIKDGSARFAARLEYAFNWCVCVLGIVLMLIGVTVSLSGL